MKSDEISAYIRKHWKPTLVIISIPLLYFARDRLGTFTTQTSYLLFVALAIALVLGDSIWKAWRYQTRHLLAPNLHASYDEYYDEGEYRITPIGSIKSDIGCWEGGEGTVVAPRRFYREWKDKGGMILFARPVEVAPSKLPAVVRDILKNRWYKGVNPPFYYTETPVVPMSLLDVSGMVCKKIVDSLPNPATGDGAKALEEIKAAITDKMRSWEGWRKEIEKKMTNETRYIDKGKESKIRYLQQKDEFLDKIIEGRHEAFVELADLDAAITAIPRKRGRERVKEIVGKEEGKSE